jgi:hypothetical protein
MLRAAPCREHIGMQDTALLTPDRIQELDPQEQPDR